MLRPFLILSLFLAAPARAEVSQGPKNVPEFMPAFENQTRAPEIADRGTLALRPVATGLENPWGIAVLPEGGYLVTERPGRLNLIASNGARREIAGVPRVLAEGQGGLLDVTLAEDFATSRRLYLTYSKPMGGNRSATAAAMATLSADMTALEDLRDIFIQMPARPSGGHFGSRIVAEGEHVFITTGDRRATSQVQNLDTTIGKVIRLFANGTVPGDNPYVGRDDADPSIWSFGHRNMQGAAIHPRTGDLWTLEHGPRGGDELNRIRPGANYGWPVTSYGEGYDGSPIGRGITSAAGVTEPVYYWDPVIAPGGFAFYDGRAFQDWRGDVIAASLNPGGIVRLTLKGDKVTGEARYLGEIGRVRDVEIDLDGSILLLTDDPATSVLRVTPG